MNTTLKIILGSLAGFLTIAASLLITRGILTCVFC